MLKNRFELAQYLRDRGYKTGAEVGVFDGYYSEKLCETIPGLKLYSIDPWAIYQGYRDRKFVSSMERAENLARTRLAQYDVTIIKDYSVEAAKEFKDESLDFVYIDGNHEYKYVMEDLKAWTPKVREGGIVCGDDYYQFRRSGNVGVIKAVNEFARERGYDLNTTLWDLDLEKEDDRQPQFWFVK